MSLEVIVDEDGKNLSIPVAFDAYGGDAVDGITACERVTKAVRRLAPDYPKSTFYLVGEKKEISSHLGMFHGAFAPRNIKVLDLFEYALQEKKGDEEAAKGYMQKYGAMRYIAELLNENEVQAMYTIGNTKLLNLVLSKDIGLLAEYKKVFPTQRLAPLFATFPKAPSVERVAEATVGDAGAIELFKTPQEFYCIAKMGMGFARIFLEREHPTVGLANIGREKGKGGQLLQETHKYLEEKLSGVFVGNVEPTSSIFEIDPAYDSERIRTDVVIAHGIVGNNFIKGVVAGAKLVSEYIKREIQDGNFLESMGAVFLKGAFNRVKQKMDPSQTGGAPFIGYDKEIWKNHGVATEEGIYKGGQKMMKSLQKRAYEQFKEVFDKLILEPA